MEHETVKNYLIYGLSSRYNHRMITQSIEPELANNLELEIAEFYNTIDGAKYVEYSSIGRGGIIIENFKGDSKVFKYDEYFDEDDGLFYVHCLYVAPNFHKVESYRVIKGRDFTDEDMIFVEGETRPVLLGYKYIDIYKVGDVLDWFCEGDYQRSYLTPKLEVIGFLEEDTTVVDQRGTTIYDLDNYIVYPEYFIPISEWDNCSKQVLRHALNRNVNFFGYTKFLIDTEHEAEGVAELQTALNEYSGFAKYYNVVNWNQALEKIHTRTETFTNFAIAITGVLMAFAVVTVVFSVINRIENNLKDYAIHVSIGASPNNVIGFVISETVIILSCSVALGLIFARWLMAELYMPYYFLEFLGIFAATSLFVMLISAITAKIALKRHDLCALIK